MSNSGKMVLLSAIVAVLGWCAPISAEPTTAQANTQEIFRDVSDELSPVIKKYKLPGIAVVVLHNDEIIASGVAGVRKYGGDVAISIHDQFHLGSCTKAFTATLCGMLVEAGKLKWDSTIGEVFPELANVIDRAYLPVTLEQLLMHRSGLPEDRTPNETVLKLRSFQGTTTEARYAWLKEALQTPPTAPPGEKFQYANLGYVIAGAMCERVTKFSWEDLIRSRIFQPLEMTSAGFGPPGVAGKIDEPLGHGPMNLPEEPSVLADNPAALGPAGTIHCSLPDWAKFVQVHLKRDKLLKPETFQKLHTPSTDPNSAYAMGWIAVDRDWADGEALTHSGSNTLWYCIAWLAPRKDFAVLVATNTGSPYAAKACDDVTGKMIEAFCPKGE